MVGVVRGGTWASSRMRAFPDAVQRLLVVHYRDVQIQRRRGHTRRSCPSSRAAVQDWPRNGTGMCVACYSRYACADDACIVSRSPRVLERMMAVLVEVFGVSCLPISERKMDTIYMHADSVCACNASSLQRHGATVSPDNLLHLSTVVRRRRH